MRACPRHRVQSCQGEPSDWSIQPLHVPRNRESRNGGVYSRIGEYLHWVSMREEAIYEISVGAAPGRKTPGVCRGFFSFLSVCLSVYHSFFLSFYLFGLLHYVQLTYFLLSPWTWVCAGRDFSITSMFLLCIIHFFHSCSYPKEWDWDYGGRDDASIGATVGS